MSVNEPKELRPFMVFGGRAPLQGDVGIVRDFRALPVDVNDTLPPRAPEVQTPDPKLQVSSVTEPVVESGADETVIPTEQTSSPTPSPETPAPAGPLPLALQRPPLTTGVSSPPAGTTTEGPVTPSE